MNVFYVHMALYMWAYMCVRLCALYVHIFACVCVCMRVRLSMCMLIWLPMLTGQELPNQAIGADCQAAEICLVSLPQSEESEFYESENKHFTGWPTSLALSI